MEYFNNQIQLWTGEQWVKLYTGTEKGTQGTTALGKVTISLAGATTIPIE